MGEKSRSKKFVIIGVLLGAVLIVEIALAIWLPLRYADDGPTTSTSVKESGEFSKICPHAAVAADSAICSSLGKQILEQGGNAVDAVITTALCSGVQNMHSCGIGGGSFLVIHDPVEKNDRFINCRETAPLSAYENMYQENPAESSYGPRSIGIPGEIKCMSVAHDKYGKLEWSKLIDPIVELVRNGVFVTDASGGAMSDSRINSIIGDKTIFQNSDGRAKQRGDQVINEKLAQTFEKISKDKTAFYNVPLAQDIVDDINEAGGDFVLEDLLNYQIDDVEPVRFEFLDYIGYVGPPPSSGAVLTFIVNIMANFEINGELPNEDNAEFLHKLTEAYKFAYGKRSLLGDRLFQPDRTEFDQLVANLTSFDYATHFYEKIQEKTLNFEDYEPAFQLVEDEGTSHMSVVDQDGMICSLTSTINTYLGSKVIGTRTGIIFNNEMDDFSSPGFNNAYGVPPSPQNFIQAGKRPLSSMAPVVITNKAGELVLTSGASGGTQITTAVAGIITKTLMLGIDLNKATQDPRIHHQLMPDSLRYDSRLDENMVKDLESRGHETRSGVGSVCQSIMKKDQKLHAVSDARKGGRPDGF